MHFQYAITLQTKATRLLTFYSIPCGKPVLKAVCPQPLLLHFPVIHSAPLTSPLSFSLCLSSGLLRFVFSFSDTAAFHGFAAGISLDWERVSLARYFVYVFLFLIRFNFAFLCSLCSVNLVCVIELFDFDVITRRSFQLHKLFSFL